MKKLWLFIPLIIILSCFSNKEKDNSGEYTDLPKHESENIKNDVQIVTFIYHRFGDNRYPSTNISATNFEKQLKYLKDNDYRVLSFEDALNELNTPNKSGRIVVLTIDDAFESFYKNGYPLLKKYQFPAILFVNTETVGGNSYMDWDQINEVKKGGIEIGNHTHSHSLFLDMPKETRYSNFKDELKLTQKLISKNLDGFTPQYFAYPYGECDVEMVKIVKNEGFKAAFAQNSGVIQSQSDRFVLPRFPMSSFYSDLTGFIEKVNMNALIIDSITPDQHLLNGLNNPPILKLKFSIKDFNSSSLQCFVQENTCKISNTVKDNIMQVTISSGKPLKNRRTLYTLTIQDKDNHWHWYSHLWIRPEIH